LLLGAPGCGKRGLAALAGLALGYELFEADGCCASLVPDLRAVQRRVVLANVPVVLLLGYRQWQDIPGEDAWLGPLYEVLALGYYEVWEESDYPNFLAAARAAGWQNESPNGLRAFVRARVAQNLHVVICASAVANPAHAKSRSGIESLALNCPPILRSCVVCRVLPWPSGVFAAYARQSTEHLLPAFGVSSPVRKQLAEHAALVYSSVQQASLPGTVPVLLCAPSLVADQSSLLKFEAFLRLFASFERARSER
jgi:hypothetical protein